MTYKSWSDVQGIKTTQEDIYINNERVGGVTSTGSAHNPYEISNLVTQARGVAEVREFRHHTFAGHEFKELFIAKRDNDPKYGAKLEAFINKYSDKIGRFAFQQSLIPRLLHSLKNESTEVKKQAKSILAELNREYFTSFTIDGFSKEMAAKIQKANPDYVPKYASQVPTVEPAAAVESNPESPKRGSPTSFGSVQPTAGLARDERFERKRGRPVDAAEAAKPAEPTRPKIASAHPAAAVAPKAAEQPKSAATMDEPKKGRVPNAFKSVMSRLRGKEPKEPDDDQAYKGPKK